jgi:prepilin-type N-terminal cleavage/methylation domain-containing protein
LKNAIHFFPKKTPLLAERAKPCLIKFWLNKPKFNQGFTLIELSVVTLLIGLMLFTVMPGVGNFLFQSDLKDVTRSLRAAVQTLRAKSIITHRNTVLHIDLDRNLFWGDFQKNDEEEFRLSENRRLFSPRNLPSGVRFMDAANINTSKRMTGTLSSSFNPKGVFEETVLHLTDSRNKILTVIINAYTGRFSLFDDYVEVEYD